jgi:hypothetical protein
VIVFILRNNRQKRIPTGQGTATITSTPSTGDTSHHDTSYITEQSAATITSTPLAWNDNPASVPPGLATRSSTPSSSLSSTTGASLEEAARPRPKRRMMLLVSVGSSILILVVIGAWIITQAQASSSTTFQQAVTTGSHVTSIEVGKEIDNYGLIQGQTDTFHPYEQSCISFNVNNGSSPGYIDAVLFQGNNTFFSSSVIRGLNPHWQGPFYKCSNVGDPGVYKWVVNFNGSSEASITFQVVS